MKVLFMGTPDFSVPTLEKLVENEHELVGVVTQPDKPKGRGKSIICTPVKECALKHDIKVYQPEKVKSEEFIQELKSIEFDVIVVVAFGQILPKEILDMPRYGCINVHSSLLPAYRGAAPIQWTIINGEKQTGVTTMYMDEGLDTGDMLLQVKTDIEDDETGGSLHDRLAVMGADLLIQTLKLALSGALTRTKQDDSESNYVGMIDKSMGNIDFDKDAEEIERLIRGLNPWPSAYTKLDGKTLKIWKAKVITSEDKILADYVDKLEDASNGEIVAVNKKTFVIKTAKDYLQCLDVQLEGKKRMECEAFLRGYNLEEGVVLG